MWSEEIQRMPREQLEALQLSRLQETVKRCYERVPFYQTSLRQRGITPQDIKSLEDLSRLPFTNKTDLRDNYPFGMFAAPMSEVVRVHASSGTTGKPTVVGYTREDIQLWAEVMARALNCGGVTEGDIVQNAYGYGLFTGGLGVHYGAEHLGATVVPTASGNTNRQIMLMQDFGTTVLCCTPSYALYIAEVLEDAGVERGSLRLRVGFFGAEPWSEGVRRQIEERLGIKALDIYGLSEIIGPGVANECMEQNGLHVFDDHFIPEIIDPDSGERLPDGEKGELVFTTITKRAFPLIRYRTRDLSRLLTEPCPCGRSHIRIERISARSDDMLIIRGVNVFPSQIEAALLNIEGVEPHYQLIVDVAGSMDVLEVQVETSEAAFQEEQRLLEPLRAKVQRQIESILGLSADVTLLQPKTLARSEGKARHVIDKRKNGRS